MFLLVILFALSNHLLKVYIDLLNLNFHYFYKEQKELLNQETSSNIYMKTQKKNESYFA